MTYSVVPFSTQAFSTTGRDVRVVFEMAFSFDVSLNFILYVATTAGFATKPSDSLPNQPFRGVLQSYSFARSILQHDIGQFTTGTGSLVIANDDAHYDFLPQNYAIDGRPINLRVGRADDPYDASFPFARLTATGWNIDTGNVSIDLVDYSYKLEVPMQPNVYGGSGGADGGADLAGKRKPMVFGAAREVPAVLLVPSLLIYQVNDGSIQAVTSVHDRGVALSAGSNYADYAALAAASITAGQYGTCLALGLFKLGSAPSGTVTADVAGDNSDGYVVTTADIVRWALRRRTSLADPGDLFVASFSDLNTAQAAPIDYWIGPQDSLTVAAFIANIMGGVGGWGGHRLDGKFAVRIFKAPTGNPVAFYSRNDMLGGDIKREPLPAAYKPPPWRWRVPYARCWTVQTDLAGSVSAAHKAFVAEPYRLAESSNASVKVDHPFAQDRDPVVAYFSNQSDAAAEALRRLNLFKATNSIYRMTLPRRALRQDMGDEIRVTHPRFDLPSGRSMIVVESRADISAAGGGALDCVEIAAYG
jgi:hypothetical protein